MVGSLQRGVVLGELMMALGGEAGWWFHRDSWLWGEIKGILWLSMATTGMSPFGL